MLNTAPCTGVAGFVVNDDRELLLIQEKYLQSLKTPIWKLPGGLAEPGEPPGTYNNQDFIQCFQEGCLRSDHA